MRWCRPFNCDILHFIHTYFLMTAFLHFGKWYFIFANSLVNPLIVILSKTSSLLIFNSVINSFLENIRSSTNYPRWVVFSPLFHFPVSVLLLKSNMFRIDGACIWLRKHRPNNGYVAMHGILTSFDQIWYSTCPF